MRTSVSILEWAVLRFVHQLLKKLAINFVGEIRISGEDNEHIIVYLGHMMIMVHMQTEFNHYVARGLVNITFDDGNPDNSWGRNLYISHYWSGTSTYEFTKRQPK